VTGLAVELLVLRFVFPMSWNKALLVDVRMNLASSLVGAIAIPLAGFAWEFFPGSILYKIFNMGTFNPVTWTATCVMAVFISTGIEVGIVRYPFGYRITYRRFWAIALANLLSTAVAYLSMLKHPPKF
jgi:hypothetical protein